MLFSLCMFVMAQEYNGLAQAVQKHGATKWANLATNLPNRPGKQCRGRYINHLQMVVVAFSTLLAGSIWRIGILSNT